MDRTPKNKFTVLALLGAMCLASPRYAAEEESEPVPGIEEDETLSEQLDEDKGVITPPDVGDADIHVPAPNPDPGTTPVIPPPSAEDPGVEPK